MYGESKGATWKQKVDHACRILDVYKEYMYKIEYDEKELIKWRSNCVHFLDVLDTRRKTNWKETCPQLAEAILEWYNLPKGLY